VQAEAQRISPALVRGAVQDAEQLLATQQYPQAVELLSWAAAVDGGVRPRLDAVRAEHERWIDAQYEAAAREGDELLSGRRFAEAQARYETALQFRRGGRAEPLARYARALAAGELAVQRRDWPAATAAYDEAIRSGQDANGYAAAELERVRIRPYALRVRTVAVKPFRADGSPWAGERGRGFDRLVGRLASAALDGYGRRDAAMDLYDALPHENRPSLVATLVLADGRRFATPPQKAIRARFESTVVFLANAYDDRPILLRVEHQDARGAVEVGAVTFRLVDALDGRLELADRGVVAARVAAEPSPLQDGSLQGFAPVAAPAAVPVVPAAAPQPAPAPAHRSPRAAR
jgi:tetratricopeptide (TPR) repeat protein